jgi:hypothetical protein
MLPTDRMVCESRSAVYIVDSVQVVQGASSTTTLSGLENLASVPTASFVPLCCACPASVRSHDVPNDTSSTGVLRTSEGTRVGLGDAAGEPEGEMEAKAAPRLGKGVGAELLGGSVGGIVGSAVGLGDGESVEA